MEDSRMIKVIRPLHFWFSTTVVSFRRIRTIPDLTKLYYGSELAFGNPS